MRARSRRDVLIAGAVALAGAAMLIAVAVTQGAAPATTASPSVVQQTRVRGSATAPITIDEYADFQCPACGAFARGVEQQLLSTYVAEGKVKLVFHHFAFLGLESNWAAEAAECAGEQGKFWEFHDRLYASQAGENRGAFGRDNLKKIGDALGLSPSFAACVDSGRYAQGVRDSMKAGQERGVRATPTLFVGDRKMEGAPTFEQLKAIIDPLLPAS